MSTPRREKLPLIKSWLVAFFILFLCLTPYIYCENSNQLVVVGSKDSTDENIAPKSTVTAKEIEQKGSTTVGDAVKEIAGVYVNGDGRTGQSQFLFVRGFRSADLLVLVDGVD